MMQNKRARLFELSYKIGELLEGTSDSYMTFGFNKGITIDDMKLNAKIRVDFVKLKESLEGYIIKSEEVKDDIFRKHFLTGVVNLAERNIETISEDIRRAPNVLADMYRQYK